MSFILPLCENFCKGVSFCRNVCYTKVMSFRAHEFAEKG